MAVVLVGAAQTSMAAMMRHIRLIFDHAAGDYRPSRGPT
jgi:hypothetical protein